MKFDKRFVYASIILSLFIISLIIACIDSRKIQEIIGKYREKNPVDSLIINSINGDIEVKGWKRDFIEVKSDKIVESRFKIDMKSIKISLDYNSKRNELYVDTKIPSRVNGKINLDIYIPFHTKLLTINSEKGNIYINEFLGNLIINSRKGSIATLFQGNYLRINSKEATIYLTINNDTFTDLSISNEKGFTELDIESIGEDSFFNYSSINSELKINIPPEIGYFYLFKYIDTKFKLPHHINQPIDIKNSDFQLLTGKSGDNYTNLSLNIISPSGSISIDRD